MMKAGKIFIFLICFCVAFGCSRKAIIVRLPTSKANSQIVVQLEKADLYFSAQDILNASEAGISKEANQETKQELTSIYGKLREMKFDTLHLPLILKEKDEERWNAYALLDLWYHKLLYEGKVSVYNKTRGKFESKIFCKRVKDRLGNVTDFYTFKDGKEFYDEVITLGE
jgi:hypothetical protein